MNRMLIAVFVMSLLVAGAVAPQSMLAQTAGDSTAATPNLATVRGCLNGQRGNYIVIEDKTNMVYVLKGVGNKLDSFLHHEVEVKGKTLPGTIKTGVNPSKAGGNPSDTVHGVDGVPLQVANVQTDVSMISKQCKAADQQ